MEMDITKIHLEFEFKVDEVDRILIGNGDLTGIVGAQMSCVFFNFFVVLLVMPTLRAASVVVNPLSFRISSRVLLGYWGISTVCIFLPRFQDTVIFSIFIACSTNQSSFHELFYGINLLLRHFWGRIVRVRADPFIPN